MGRDLAEIRGRIEAILYSSGGKTMQYLRSRLLRNVVMPGSNGGVTVGGLSSYSLKSKKKYSHQGLLVAALQSLEMSQFDHGGRNALREPGICNGR